MVLFRTPEEIEGEAEYLCKRNNTSLHISFRRDTLKRWTIYLDGTTEFKSVVRGFPSKAAAETFVKKNLKCRKVKEL